jgi:uncharacterized membrane protein YdjX (TVP38/TMEM64 family)
MRADHPRSRRDWRTVPRGLGLLACLAVIGLLWANTQLGATLGPAWVDAEVRGHGLAGELLFVCVAGLLTAVGVPRQLVSFLGGYAFGLIFGSVLAVLATLIGCAASFYSARLLGRAYVARRFSGRVRQLDNFIRAHPLGMTLLIRLSPVGNNLITNLLAGVTSVRPSLFLAGSAIGYVPQTIVFALGGSGVNVDPAFRIALSVVLFIVFGALGAWLFREFRHGKPLDFDTESELTYASRPRA